MDIREAKQQVKDTVEAYLARDEEGFARIVPAEQRPLFLVGAPGIGKTAIVSQVAEELGIGLVAYSMTHHTRQSALGLPFIVHRSYRNGAEFDISEYTMSEIIASIYDYMEESGKDEGILFLDEINCVSETLYPSMLQFLQFKTFGRHKVPEGWIVVCAGNPPEYNRSVHEFDIVTMDRLRKIEVEPSFEAWCAFSRERRVHPAVMTYLEVRPEDFYLVESTPQGKQFVCARSWSELSGLMMQLERLEKSVDLRVIEQYVQHPEIASRFAAYYELFMKYRSDYQVEAILQGDVPAGIVSRAQEAAFDERLALLALLLDGLEVGMGGLLERLSALGMVRDGLRAAKAQADAIEGASADFAALMGAEATRVEQEAHRAALSTMGLENAHAGVLAASMLRELGALGAYDAAAAAYRAEVDTLNDDADDVCARIDCAYAFVDRAFGEGGEALVFTTELAARSCSARYLARFGSDSYHAHSEALAVDATRDSIFEEIDAYQRM